MRPPRGACGAFPQGRRVRTGEAGSAAAPLRAAYDGW